MCDTMTNIIMSSIEGTVVSWNLIEETYLTMSQR